MSRIKSVEKLAKQVLTENEAAREDDFRLVYEVYKIIFPNIDNLSFKDVMLNHKVYNLPYFESVRRTRQKLQNKFPELQARKEVVEARSQEEVEYRNYALEDIIISFSSLGTSLNKDSE